LSSKEEKIKTKITFTQQKCKDIEKIKDLFNINYKSNIIDFSDKEKINSLGKREIELISKRLRSEAEFFKCEELKINSIQLFSNSLKNFSIFFINCKTLRILDLVGCYIADLGCRCVAEILSKAENITEINLQKNMIGDKGAEMIASTIRETQNLAKIELEHNLIGNLGAELLYSSLKVNIKIKWLNLFGNITIDRNLISSISSQLRSNRLSNRAKIRKSSNL
jgi:Ran GTPase-activating protein (RanGAP) involved in mRNA processing and transport